MVSIGGLDPETRQRFYDARRQSQEAQNLEELINGEFFAMLLDVWALHRQRERDMADLPNAPAATAGGEA